MRTKLGPAGSKALAGIAMPASPCRRRCRHSLRPDVWTCVGGIGERRQTPVRINNLEAPSTSGSTGGGQSNPHTPRAFDFNTFASQRFDNASVRKPASAETDGGSLSAGAFRRP